MKKKYKQKFNDIADRLFRINQMAVYLEDDEDAKQFSCYLIELIEGRLKNE